MARYRLGVIVLALACSALAWTIPAIAHNSAARGGTINVTAGKPGEFKFTLSKKSITKGAVTFFVTNKGALAHDFKINGKVTKRINAGQSTTLKVAFTKAGSYPYLCSVSGHAAAGMKGVLKVT
jgi:uncharacterized cupredoxin-like copper-binding protein